MTPLAPGLTLALYPHVLGVGQVAEIAEMVIGRVTVAMIYI
nr:hypothetical protein [Dietzia cinnamea]